MGRDKKRILIADDNASIREALRIRLGRSGYDVLEAGEGFEALRLWQTQEVDLVITDIHMPNKNGLELILELRTQSPHTPIIAMSDGGQTNQLGLLGDVKLLGVVRTIQKPFSLSEMVALVKSALKGEP